MSELLMIVAVIGWIVAGVFWQRLRELENTATRLLRMERHTVYMLQDIIDDLEERKRLEGHP